MVPALLSFQLNRNHMCIKTGNFYFVHFDRCHVARRSSPSCASRKRYIASRDTVQYGFLNIPVALKRPLGSLCSTKRAQQKKQFASTPFREFPRRRARRALHSTTLSETASQPFTKISSKIGVIKFNGPAGRRKSSSKVQPERHRLIKFRPSMHDRLDI